MTADNVEFVHHAFSGSMVLPDEEGAPIEVPYSAGGRIGIGWAWFLDCAWSPA